MGKKRGFSSKRKRKYNKVYRKESLIAADTTTPQHLIVSVPVTKLQSTMARFLVLRNALKTATLPAGWMQVPAVTEIALCHILLLKKPTISHTISILSDCSFTVSIYNNTGVSLPITFTIDNIDTVIKLLNYVTSLKICPGNGLTKYVRHAEQRGGTLFNRSGEVVAFMDNYPFVTIRHHQCTIVQEQGVKCSACSSYRKSLQLLSKYHTEPFAKDISKKTNHRFLSKPTLINEVSILRAAVYEKDRKIEYLQKMIAADNRAISLDGNEHNDMLSIMKAHHDTIIKSYPEDSFQRIFWNGQYMAAQAKSPNGFRWNPAIIKWCIYLCHKSSSAYELLRKTKILHLPSHRTLRQYSNALDSSSGFSNELDEQLFCDAKVSSLQEFQKYVGLVGDEMYIKEGLVYDESTGKLVGYCDIGNINNHLLLLEKEYMENDAEHRKATLAKTMMMLMVRGLFTDLEFPYASFPTGNLTGEQLVPIFYEALLRVERSGLKVAAITLDGNSVNRKYFKIVGTGDTAISHKFNNPLSFNKREIYLFSDPPHLLKTSRNCLYNTRRHMEFRGKPISWKYIRQLYEITTKSTGVTTLPKLKYENVYLTSYSKMRVDLASEVLSESVAVALKVHLKEEAKETIVFVEMFDKFFDMLNVTNYTKCITKRKHFQSPYRWSKDIRLEWLKNTFLKWLEEWENEAKSRENLKAAERKKLILSDETLLGLRITAYSFIDLVQFIFTIPGVKSFLSERISQDPLEKYFGRQRQRGNSHENPSSQEFLKNNGALRVVNSIKINTHRGNTQQHDTTDVYISTEPLKKKKKTSSGDSGSNVSSVPSPASSSIIRHSKETIDLLSVICQAIEDSGFNIQSAEAKAAKKSAIKIKECMINNKSRLMSHDNCLAYFFNLWISVAPANSVIREQIWIRFAQFTSSDEYTRIWNSIYSDAEAPHSSVLSFYVTYHYFIRLWESKYPTSANNTKCITETKHLSYDEENAIWYIGGYIIRKVRRKIKVLDNKDDLLAMLEKFEEKEDTAEDESLTGDDDDDDAVDTKKWISLIDRGGLVKCSNNFYSFLRSVELEIKDKISHDTHQLGKPNEVATIISGKPQIKQIWKFITEDELSPGDSHRLINEILQLYIKVRFFAFTKKTMEHYKIQNNKNLQKSKSFRSKINAE